MNEWVREGAIIVVLLFFNAPLAAPKEKEREEMIAKRKRSSRHPVPANFYSYFTAINFFAVYYPPKALLFLSSSCMYIRVYIFYLFIFPSLLNGAKSFLFYGFLLVACIFYGLFSIMLRGECDAYKNLCVCSSYFITYLVTVLNESFFVFLNQFSIENCPWWIVLDQVEYKLLIKMFISFCSIILWMNNILSFPW